MWQTQAPSRAAFFSWSVALCKILTVDNLRKRNIIIVDRCCLCKRDVETVDHLLFHCDVASTLWIHVFTRFGILGLCLKELSIYLLVDGSLESKECCGLEDGA
jgi:hypothetical protein